MMDHRPRTGAPRRKGLRRSRRTHDGRKRRYAAILALAAALLGLVPPRFSVADPRPLVPPLAWCKDAQPCPSAAASCIPLPYIEVGEHDPGSQPRVWSLTINQAVQIAIANSEAVRNLGLVEAASKNDIVRSVI